MDPSQTSFVSPNTEKHQALAEDFFENLSESILFQTHRQQIIDHPENAHKSFPATLQLLYREYADRCARAAGGKPAGQAQPSFYVYLFYLTERLYRNENLYKYDYIKKNLSGHVPEDDPSRRQIPGELNTALAYFFSDAPAQTLEGFRSLLARFHREAIAPVIPEVDSTYQKSRSLEKVFPELLRKPGAVMDPLARRLQDTFTPDRLATIHEDILYRAVIRLIRDQLSKQKKGKVKKSRQTIYQAYLPQAEEAGAVRYRKEDCDALLRALEKDCRDTGYPMSTLLIPIRTHPCGCTLYIASESFARMTDRIYQATTGSQSLLQPGRHYLYLFSMGMPAPLDTFIPAGVRKPAGEFLHLSRGGISLQNVHLIADLAQVFTLSDIMAHISSEGRSLHKSSPEEWFSQKVPFLYTEELDIKKLAKSFGYDFDQINQAYDAFCQEMMDMLPYDEERPVFARDEIPEAFHSFFEIDEEDWAEENDRMEAVRQLEEDAKQYRNLPDRFSQRHR